MPRCFGFAILLALGACVQEGSPEAVRSMEHAMVGGTTSTAAQNSTVWLKMGDEDCSGVLIAPNLVLTARHCVSKEADDSCGAFGDTIDASSIEVYVGIANPYLDDEASPVAEGVTITVPSKSEKCGYDVALVQLDQEIAGGGDKGGGPKVAKVRFGELARNETTIAVGYGMDENNEPLDERQQRSTTVLGVGPGKVNYTTKSKETVSVDIPAGDILTGESTCFGDSGGPLLDSEGRVVGVTSRGVPELFSDDGTHGENTCLDEPSVFASVRKNEDVIRRAAKAAGFELPET